MLIGLPPLGDSEKTIENVIASYAGFITLNPSITLPKENIAEINNLCKNIILADRAFQKGQIIECYDRILEELQPRRYSYPIFKICKKDEGSFFYRMRACEGEYLFSKEELFHTLIYFNVPTLKFGFNTYTKICNLGTQWKH